jgi:hypothetical protein
MAMTGDVSTLTMPGRNEIKVQMTFSALGCVCVCVCVCSYQVLAVQADVQPRPAICGGSDPLTNTAGWSHDDWLNGPLHIPTLDRAYRQPDKRRG